MNPENVHPNYTPSDRPHRPDPYTTPAPGAPVPPKGRSHRGLGILIVGLAILAALCGLGTTLAIVSDGNTAPVASQPFDGPDSATPADRPTTAPPAVKAKPVAVVLGDGTWEVAAKTNVADGTLAPGAYKIHTPESGLNCHWARVRDFDGELLTSIIANGNVGPGSTARVNVKKTDAGLELKGDCEARK